MVRHDATVRVARVLDGLRRAADGTFDRDVVAAIEWLAVRFLTGRDALFAERIEAARIVDGHGDLLAEDIFLLPDGPQILDCLEFDDRLRWVDGNSTSELPPVRRSPGYL